MQKKTGPAFCSVPVGSITQAMHARELLGRRGIRAEVVRNDPASSRSGCAYAVSCSCSQERTVRSILRSAGFRRNGGD